jgi:hypothetical protein
MVGVPSVQIVAGVPVMSEDYCEKHDVDITKLSDDYADCPYCIEEERIEREEMERATRDRSMEPY